MDKFTAVKGQAKNLKVKFRHILNITEALEVVRMNYDNFCITILDGGSKCSIFSNIYIYIYIGNCHYFDELYWYYP